MIEKGATANILRFVAEILLVVSTVGAMHHLVSNHFSIDSHLSLLDLSFQADKFANLRPKCESFLPSDKFYCLKGVSLVFFFVTALSFKLVSLKS